MIIVVAKVRVKPDKVELYEQICREYMPAVRATEPGQLFYDVGRSREEPGLYTVVEVYRDQAAVDAHIANTVARGPIERLGPCLEGEPVIQILDAVAPPAGPAG